MRLIDADTLVERINALYEWCEDERKMGLEQAMCIIHEQPTAYDVEKVCEELTDEKEWAESDFWEFLAIDAEIAIETVRRGGV